MRRAGALLLLWLVAACSARAQKLIEHGPSRTLRDRHDARIGERPRRPRVVIVALDGIDRDLLYGLVHDGALPGLTRLLGGDDLRHAYFEDGMLSVLPSSTIPAWATLFTGATPGQHGVSGNEFFIREERRFAAFAPASFSANDEVMGIYTDDLLDRLLPVPTLYERMRAARPDVLAWVSMSQIYRGADRLLLVKQNIVTEAMGAFLAHPNDMLSKREPYAALDQNALDEVIDALGGKVVPDLLTVYLAGADLFAHKAERGPDTRAAYLEEVVDGRLGKLADRLAALPGDGFVVVVADHGHTGVVADDAHALADDPKNDPPAVLTGAGFRVRPFKLKVEEAADFQSVLAYQGAMAFVYLADRSGCAAPGTPCDWTRPPRFQEDVLAAADAFYRADAQGPAMKGTLDMVLARRPRPFRENDEPFQVYVGGGRLQPVPEWLKEHPHPTYVDVESRLEELAVGRYGERAGDVLLVAHEGDRDHEDQRYYFLAGHYHSWHGSPSRADSSIPFILAAPQRDVGDLRDLCNKAFGEHPRPQRFVELVRTLLQPPPPS